MERYDIAIVGSGPAGLEAAINARIRNKNIIFFGSRDLSDKLSKAPIINNYLGFSGIKGNELKIKFQQHINDMNISLVYERINTIYAMGDYFTLMVNEKTYEARSIILATGVEYTKPLKGEEKFSGKGVGYCATCDAPLYKGKTVIAISYNKSFESEANYVNELAGKLYYVPLYEGRDKLNSAIEIINEKPIEIQGGDRVTKLIFANRIIDTEGIFILKDSVPPSQLVPGLEIDNGHIKVDRNMLTNIKGCFAAGDCIGKPYQYMKAAGEGQVAALNAVVYLDNLKSNS